MAATALPAAATVLPADAAAPFTRTSNPLCFRGICNVGPYDTREDCQQSLDDHAQDNVPIVRGCEGGTSGGAWFFQIMVPI